MKADNEKKWGLKAALYFQKVINFVESIYIGQFFFALPKSNAETSEALHSTGEKITGLDLYSGF